MFLYVVICTDEADLLAQKMFAIGEMLECKETRVMTMVLSR
jgi:hypothetical protein